MRTKRRPKPTRKINRKMRTKFLVLFSVVIACLCGLVGRIIWLNSVKGNEYSKKVLSLQSYSSQSIPFQRGDITDCNGTLLATSVPVYNLILDCSQISDEEIEPTVEALTGCFPDLDADELKDYIENNKDNMYKVLKKQLTYSELQPIVDLINEVDEDGKSLHPDVDGIWWETEYQRQYPFGNLASSVIGFTSAGNVGTTGIENYYDDTLNGADGREYGYLNSDNAFEKTVIDAEDGCNLVTSLDANIQSIVEDKLEDFYYTYSNNYRKGGGYNSCSIIIEDPNTGEILAMADYPSFDLNNPRDLSELYSEEELEAMDDEQTLTVLNQLWQNFCVTDAYEPGSVQKPLTVATGFETGTLTEDMSFYCDGGEYFTGQEERIKCVNTSGHGTETIEKALMDSCNDALMQMSYLIGADNFTNYQQTFGFGQKTGIDLPGESSCSSMIYTLEQITKIDLATNSFGQNYDCTMIQMISAFSSLINGGYYYQPHIVTRITDSDGNTVSDIEPTVVRNTVSKSTSDLVKSYLESVVKDGTGNTAKVDGYSMGGKTGTAEKIPRGTGNYVVSFMGFAPVDDPQVVIYCVMDTPNVEDQAHSAYAQNIVREILEEVFPYMNIYPDEEKDGTNEDLDITGNGKYVPTHSLGLGPMTRPDRTTDDEDAEDSTTDESASSDSTDASDTAESGDTDQGENSGTSGQSDSGEDNADLSGV